VADTGSAMDFALAQQEHLAKPKWKPERAHWAEASAVAVARFELALHTSDKPWNRRAC